MVSKRAAFAQKREQMLTTLTEMLRNDERFVAAWLAGSYGRGEQTVGSDLDLHVVVADAYSEVLCAKPWEAGAKTTPERLALFSQIEAPSFAGDVHQNNQLGGTFTYVAYLESALNVDWMLTPQHAAHQLPDTRMLFDKVGLTAAPPAEPETLEERAERASSQVGWFWLDACENARNLLAGNLCEFHEMYTWMVNHVREVRAALRGEQVRWISNTHSRVYATREEQVAALRALCDEMEMLMPEVVRLGGYVPKNPRVVVEKRLALL